MLRAWLLMLCLWILPVKAGEGLPPDIALLEFLGMIAGLESMGLEIDALLEGDEEAVEAVNESRVTEENADG